MCGAQPILGRSDDPVAVVEKVEVSPTDYILGEIREKASINAAAITPRGKENTPQSAAAEVNRVRGTSEDDRSSAESSLTMSTLEAGWYIELLHAAKLQHLSHEYQPHLADKEDKGFTYAEMAPRAEQSWYETTELRFRDIIVNRTVPLEDLIYITTLPVDRRFWEMGRMIGSTDKGEDIWADGLGLRFTPQQMHPHDSEKKQACNLEGKLVDVYVRKPQYRRYLGLRVDWLAKEANLWWSLIATEQRCMSERAERGAVPSL
jgi:hypothetical protein